MPSRLVEARLGSYARDELGVELDTLLAMGRANPEDEREPMTTAWLAMRGSGAVTAVSRRHAEVSRRIFQVQFARWPEVDVPVGHVTNGVHVPSWDSEEADALWTSACGEGRWDGAGADVGEKIAACSDTELWAFRAKARAHLVAFVRERLSGQLAAAGVGGSALDTASRVLDGDALTIGLARRFVEYKRPGLLLHDTERLARLLLDARRPVQIVVAGKAHPRDEQGKALVARWVQFARRDEVRPHVVFLADYDLRLAEHLVQGVDLWLNTPRPPWEACGTSGMKVLVNGGVNLSSLDGWWAEAYQPEVGWAIPGDGHDDARDARALYELLERDIVPAFYERDPAGLPGRWVARMRRSMASLTATYSASRALREYTERYYVPAARAYAARSAQKGLGGGEHRAMGARRETAVVHAAFRRGARPDERRKPSLYGERLPRGSRAGHGHCRTLCRCLRNDGSVTNADAPGRSTRGCPRLRLHGRSARRSSPDRLHGARGSVLPGCRGSAGVISDCLAALARAARVLRDRARAADTPRNGGRNQAPTLRPQRHPPCVASVFGGLNGDEG